MPNVRTYIELNCRVCQANDKSDPNTRPGLEKGKQYHDIHKCRTAVIDENEWRWRFQTARAILCSGSATTYGNYTDDAIGGLFE